MHEGNATRFTILTAYLFPLQTVRFILLQNQNLVSLESLNATDLK